LVATNWQAHFKLGLADFFIDRSIFRAAERQLKDHRRKSSKFQAPNSKRRRAVLCLMANVLPANHTNDTNGEGAKIRAICAIRGHPWVDRQRGGGRFQVAGHMSGDNYYLPVA
jgi:hypothetical protein